MALDAAVALLEEEGPDRLTTRAVARRIGYTVGSLYFVFRNRDDLILQVNERTLLELQEVVDTALAGVDDPMQALLAMGRSYLIFAQTHTSRWRLIFEHEVANRDALPPTLTGRIDGLFGLVAAQLERIAPDLSLIELRSSAHALWGGVHGITVLAVTGKLFAGGEASAKALTDDLITRYLRGLAPVSGSKGIARGP